jgi:uncharacterized membrane protein YgcG
MYIVHAWNSYAWNAFIFQGATNFLEEIFMTKLLATAAAVALLTATSAMAQMGTAPSKPGDPTSMGGKANCPAGTTSANCQGNSDGSSNPTSGRSSSTPGDGSGGGRPGGSDGPGTNGGSGNSGGNSN